MSKRQLPPNGEKGTEAMRKIGIVYEACPQLCGEVWAQTVTRLGFSATFTDTYESDRKQAMLAELFAKYGIAYDTIHAPFGHINDIWLDCEGGSAMERELTDAVDRCVAAAGPVAVMHLSSGMTPPPITDLGRSRWARVVEYARKKGVTIAFENQRWLANLSFAMETFPDQGFCWDCGHEACFTPGKQFMPLFGDHLVCLHLHDNSGRPNADDHRLPFDGQVDYPRVIRQLKQSDFRGTLMLEVFAKPQFYGTDTPMAYLQKAADAAKRLRLAVDGE